MECADFLVAAGRSSATWKPAKQWRKAMNVIRTCHRLTRLALLMRRTGSYVAIRIYDDDSDETDAKTSAGASSKPSSSTALLEKLSVSPDDEILKDLVKDKRLDCFRRLGGAAGLAKALASGAETGIRGGDADILRRREAFGANTFPKRKPKSFFHHVWEEMSDVFLIVLLVCAAVSLSFGIKEHGLKDGWYDGVSIFLAVFLVAGVSAVRNHGQAKRFDRLACASDDITATVVRGGRRQDVSVFDLVVGDAVVLKIGDVVPADGVFLPDDGGAATMQVDESSMTGEPHPVDIHSEPSPFLASGVKVIDGCGTMLVTAVGTHTAWGEMMRTITRENTEPTPLQERLERLTSSVGKVGVAATVLVFAVLTSTTKDKQGNLQFDKTRVTFNTLFSGLVGILEGLPLAMTLTLMFSMKRMDKENALVRRLSACETMGSVTAICTDKTGILTLNQMKVTEFWVVNDRPASRAAISSNVVSLLRLGAGMNTTGSVYKPDNVSPLEISGSPPDTALLSWAVEHLGLNTDLLKGGCKVLRVEAFNTDRKRSGVLVRDNSTGAVVAHWKGAAEMILANCSAYVGASDGAARQLGVEQRRSLEKVISDMAAGSLRCIAFAYKQQADDDDYSKIDDDGLTLLGFVGLKDPCRPEVKDSIEACTKAGVAVKMVTGDNVLTARAITMECCILTGNNQDAIVIEGHEFRAMSPDQQLAIVEKIHVMARTLEDYPELKQHKHKSTLNNLQALIMTTIN